MFKSIAITFRPNDTSCVILLDELISFLAPQGYAILLPQYDILSESRFKRYIVPDDEFLHRADLIIAIGGDGTFLRTARIFSETGKPIVGINRGRLGFLTEFGPHEFLSHLKEILAGSFTINRRIVLEAEHIRQNEVLSRTYFINDAVISKSSFSRAIRLELEINNEYLNSYSGDGLIISTPTGSTAYSLSAGGPIIVPSAASVYVLSPICPHSLAMRPMVIPDDSILKARIVSDLKNLLLTIDGQEAIEIDGEDEIVFRKSSRVVNIITHPDKNFFAILREKLGWG